VVTLPDTRQPMAINAGGQAVTTGGMPYAADMGYQGGRTHRTTAAIADTTADTLYQSERYGDMSYRLALPNGLYQLRLKFAEIYWGAKGKRIFNVLLNGTRIITNLDIYAKVGKNRAYDMEVPVTVTNGQVVLQFQSIVNYAKISAIALQKAP
jgi:Malectin domain